MITPEVQQWISTQVGAGATREALFAQLFAQGYLESEINTALNQAFNPVAQVKEVPWWQKNILLILSGLLLVASVVIFAYVLITA